ncbi:metal-dependent hydrolase [Candidatus Woesearchaeota archaeon]|nr:metal-dependent hydrolase [Candidatus Woesearchaeota archaeon]
MLARTHLAFGFLAAIWLKPMIVTNNTYIFLALFLLGTILPDLDNEHSLINSKIPIIPHILAIFLKHRGIFHSIYLAILFPGLVWFFINKSYGVALFLGYTSHLLIDGFTKAGVNLLHPLSHFKIEGPIATGKIKEHVLLAILIALIVIKLF